ncbi:DUF2778 domain-containing protein [Paraburkholderia caribensis]|nr:DUF2778 domain-containing protein [Paraburkholderia caribensis]
MVDPYSSERAAPTLPLCQSARLALSFDGRSLTMTGVGPFRVYAAVSGRPLGNGLFDYSLARQRERQEGPIPEGRYWIRPSQMWTNHWYSLAPRAAWGGHRITIHVFPGTHTFSRGGFFIHGGTHLGSAGCINLHMGMEVFVRDLQDAVGDNSDCYIPMVVQYARYAR